MRSYRLFENNAYDCDLIPAKKQPQGGSNEFRLSGYTARSPRLYGDGVACNLIAARWMLWL